MNWRPGHHTGTQGFEMMSVNVKRKTPRTGDIIEVPVAGGFAYAQYVHNHAKYGELMALLPGVYASRPADLNELTREQELYFFFLPLKACLRRGQTVIAANEPVPASRQTFPIMRSHGIVTHDTKTVTWFLWDGEQSNRLNELKSEHYDLSIRGVWGFELLVLRINEGWMPRDYLSQFRDDLPE